MRIRVLPGHEAGPVVDAVFAGLSARSRYLRFHSPVRRLSEPLRRQLTDLDGRRRTALVAELTSAAGPVPIGLVRLADLGGGAADVALAVIDSWHRRGVGRRLLTAAAELAERLGHTELHASVLAGNTPVRRLIRATFPQARAQPAGSTTEFTVRLGPARWSVTEADVLADLLGRGS